MSPQSDSPMVPCSKCHQLYAAADSTCPHCGAAASGADPKGRTRRVFLASALAAGAMAGAVALFWNRLRWLFVGSVQTIYGEGKVTNPVNLQSRLEGPETDPSWRPAGSAPAVEAYPELREAYSLHESSAYDQAVQAYEKVLKRRLRSGTEDWVRAWKNDAENRRAPRR